MHSEVSRERVFVVHVEHVLIPSNRVMHSEPTTKETQMPTERLNPLESGHAFRADRQSPRASQEKPVLIPSNRVMHSETQSVKRWKRQTGS